MITSTSTSISLTRTTAPSILSPIIAIDSIISSTSNFSYTGGGSLISTHTGSIAITGGGSSSSSGISDSDWYLTNTSTVAMANTFNLEDDPISLVFFFTNILTLLYIAHRACVLSILSKATSRLKGPARGTSLWKKLLVICWPGLFALLLLIRTTTHALNNACFELVPLAYLMRFSIHNMLLAFQLRAVFIIRFNSLWLSRPQNLRLFSRWIFPVLLIPVAILIILFWAFRTGAALSGVCTLIAPWDWIAQSYEYLFVAFNIACEIMLRRSGIILDQKKRELQIATRISLVLLCYDTLFRFGLVQYIIEVSCGGDKTSSTYKGLSKAYSILFSTIFVGGLSSYFAYTYELFWARHCGLTHPFQRRYWRLLLGDEELTQMEQDFYKTRKVANHSTRTAKHTAPQGEPMINAASSPTDDLKTPSSNGQAAGGFKKSLHGHSNGSNTTSNNDSSGVDVKRGGYDLDEEDDSTRGSSTANSRQPLNHNGHTKDGNRSTAATARGTSSDGMEEDDEGESHHDGATIDNLDSPELPRAGSRQSMPPVSFEAIPMTRSGSSSRGIGHGSINYSSNSSSDGSAHHNNGVHNLSITSRSSMAALLPITASSPTLSPSVGSSLHRSSSATNTSAISTSSSSGTGRTSTSSPPLTSSSPILQSVVVVPLPTTVPPMPSVSSTPSSSSRSNTPTPPAGSMMDYGSVHSVKMASSVDITNNNGSSLT